MARRTVWPTVLLIDTPDEEDMMQTAFRAHLEGIGRARKTIDTYVRVVQRCDEWLREQRGHPIEASVPAAVRAWSDTTPYTWSTRRQQVSAISQWQQVVRHPHDLAAAIVVPRKPVAECRAPEDDETARIEAAAHQAGHRGVAVLLGLYLGMRCAEIASAMWSGYDGETFTWLRAKGGKKAVLPVHPSLRAALDAQDRWSPYIFPSSVRRPPNPPHVAPQTIWEWIVKISEAAGTRITTHQLRHASIAQVVDTQGIYVGQHWAGHDDVRTTQGYSRVRQHQLRAAMESLTWASEDRPPAA